MLILTLVFRLTGMQSDLNYSQCVYVYELL